MFNSARFTLDLYFDPERIDQMFPVTGEDAQTVTAGHEAQSLALVALGSPGTVEWHLPGVFSVRYGSSYVATARSGNSRVRFHSTEGDFQEGDDR